MDVCQIFGHGEEVPDEELVQEEEKNGDDSYLLTFDCPRRVKTRVAVASKPSKPPISALEKNSRWVTSHARPRQVCSTRSAPPLMKLRCMTRSMKYQPDELETKKQKTPTGDVTLFSLVGPQPNVLLKTASVAPAIRTFPVRPRFRVP